MGEPSIDSLHDPYEDQLSAARYKAERDAAVQDLKALRERNIELWMESGMANELVTCAEQKAERLGKLVWRLQNRLARSHRREKQLRKGMREWREKAIGGPVRTVSAYDLLPEEDLQALRWVREQGGLDAVKTHAELFRRLKFERDKFRDLCRDYEKAIDKPQVTMSAYDLLPEEDLQALRWVREQGGLGSVKKLFDWMIGHYFTEQQLDFDFWLSGRVMYELGFDEDMADRDEVERRLLARLMPEGYEWPRYDTGEPVRIGDVVSDVEVRSVVLREDGIILSDCTSVPGWGTWRSYKEPIKRPAPKVLDADGVEIREGDTVWDTNGDELVIGAIEDGGHTVTCRYADVGDAIPVHGMWSPSQLTHERPVADTWERLEEDAAKSPCDYFGFDGEETCGRCPASGKNCEQTMARDIVRRCRALAERERGE